MKLPSNEARFESWWRTLPLAYDSDIKELYKNAYLAGCMDTLALSPETQPTPTCDKCGNPLFEGHYSRICHKPSCESAEFERGRLAAAKNAVNGREEAAKEPQDVKEKLTQLLIETVRLAIVRWDLREESGEDIGEDEAVNLAQDTAWAMQGEGTCDETPTKEWTDVLAAIRSFAPQPAKENK